MKYRLTKTAVKCFRCPIVPHYPILNPLERVGD